VRSEEKRGKLGDKKRKTTDGNKLQITIPIAFQWIDERGEIKGQKGRVSGKKETQKNQK